MALGEIIDLEERRRARRTPVAGEAQVSPIWCVVWVPVYYWYMP